jgi:hypothetical protein
MRRRLLAAILILIFLASSVAALGPVGLPVAAWLLAMPGGIWLWRVGGKRADKWLLAVGIFLLTGILIALLLPGGPAVVTKEMRRAHCADNLKRIGLALLSYQEAYKCFPPASVCDEGGKPMHSWRVLILPYLKRFEHDETVACGDLYKKYSFKEPWNGPNNGLLESSIPPWLYVCPDVARDSAKEFALTTYVLVTGPNTAFPGCKSRWPGEITRRPRDTVLVVEVANSDIHWMEPRDPSLDDMVAGRAGVCKPMTSRHLVSDYWLDPETGIWHIGGGNIVCADGSVHFLRGPISPEDARALLTVNDGRGIDIEEFAKQMPLVGRLRWDHVIGLPAFCLSFVGLMWLALTTRRREERQAPVEMTPKGEEQPSPPSVP